VHLLIPLHLQRPGVLPQPSTSTVTGAFRLTFGGASAAGRAVAAVVGLGSSTGASAAGLAGATSAGASAAGAAGGPSAGATAKPQDVWKNRERQQAGSPQLPHAVECADTAPCR
jgi:hypothetical protein